DDARKFKPHPECYALVEKKLGLKTDEVLFVSSNSFDVTGAKHFGFKVAWIRRGGLAAPASPIGPAQMYRLVRGNAETLRYSEGFTVAAFAHLVTLLLAPTVILPGPSSLRRDPEQPAISCGNKSAASQVSLHANRYGFPQR